MELHRRRFLQLAATAAAVPATSGVVQAQAYPSRPVRIVVGYPAGPIDEPTPFPRIPQGDTISVMSRTRAC
jgi:hypothetical protein